MGDCNAGSSSGSKRNGGMAKKTRQGAGHSKAICHHDDGHCAKAHGVAHACLLAGYSDAAMQEQVSNELLHATAETITVCARQGASCESAPCNHAGEPGAKSTVADHCEAQAWKDTALHEKREEHEAKGLHEVGCNIQNAAGSTHGQLHSCISKSQKATSSDT